MKLNEFEEMLNGEIRFFDNCSTAKSIRALGYNLHFYNEITGHNNTDDQPIKWKGLVGLEGVPSSYMTVFDGLVESDMTRVGIFWLYKQAFGRLHRFAVNAKYGINCYLPANVITSIMDTARLSGVQYNELLKGCLNMGLISNKNYIMEDTDMTYILLNKPTAHGGTRWLAALMPKKIHFNGPATVVEWNDGTKTVVKCQRGDTFDPFTGVAMCCMKKMLGTNESGSNYLNDVTKLIDEAWEANNKRYKNKERRLKQKWEAKDKRYKKKEEALKHKKEVSNQEDKHD